MDSLCSRSKINRPYCSDSDIGGLIWLRLVFASDAGKAWASIRRNSQNTGQIRTKFGRNGAGIGRTCKEMAKVGVELVVKCGRIRAKFGRNRTKSFALPDEWSKFAKFGKHWAKFGRKRDLGRHRPNIGLPQAYFGPIRTNACRSWPASGRNRANTGPHRTTCAELGQMSAQLGSNLATEFTTISPETPPQSSKLCQRRLAKSGIAGGQESCDTIELATPRAHPFRCKFVLPSGVAATLSSKGRAISVRVAVRDRLQRRPVTTCRRKPRSAQMRLKLSWR